jgi:hypothetical protein
VKAAFAKGFGETSLAAGLLLFIATSAFAQQAPELREHRVTINAGAIVLGGYGIGSKSAQLRGNGPGAATTPFTLLSADSSFTRSTAPEFRVGVSLTKRLALEFGATRGNPRIGVSISNDAESSAQVLPGEELEQYVFDGGINWQLPIDLGRRLAPFVTAGGGYLRQLHEDRTLAETGQIYYAGGGARYWLRGGHGKSRPLGLRGEFRMNMRRNGIDFEDKMRTYPTVSLLLFIGV